jgi:hypothetical protein
MVRSPQIAIQLIDTQLLDETVGQVMETSRAGDVSGGSRSLSERL